MSPSETIILQRINPEPIAIRDLDTTLLLSILNGGFGLCMMEIIGVQSELDRRREQAWEEQGRHFYQYAPLLNEATENAFGQGYFSNRYFDFNEEDYFAVSF